MVTIYTLKQPQNTTTTPPKITSPTYQMNPLGSTKIAEWEQKLFLSSSTRPPQHIETH